MWCDQLRFFALSVYAVAGPAVLTGVLHHSGPDGVHLNVSLTGKKVGFLLDNAGTESALPKGSASLISPVDILDIALPEPFHQAACAVFLFRGEQEVDMVCHEGIGMDSALCFFRIFLQPIKIKEIVFFGEEAGLPVIAALDDVERGARHYDSWSSWHGEQFTLSDYNCKLLIVVCPLISRGIIRKLPRQNRYQVTVKGMRLSNALNALLAASIENLIKIAA